MVRGCQRGTDRHPHVEYKQRHRDREHAITIELAVYGRDASDARMLAKLWRFFLYRDSGPTLILDRMQQVEHEAYLTLMAGRAGVLVPEVLAAGRFGPSNDAALVTRLPDGPPLSPPTRLTAADSPVADGIRAHSPVADATLDELLLTVLRLRAAGIAYGALGSDDHPGRRGHLRAELPLRILGGSGQPP